MKKMTILLFIFIFTCLPLWGQIDLNTTNPIHWSATYESVGVDEYIIQFTANIDKGWYLYGQDRSNDYETEFSFNDSTQIIIIGNTDQLEEIGDLIKGYDKELDVHYTKYTQQVIFKRTIRVTQDTTDIIARVQYMSCDDRQCLPPTQQSFETLTIYKEEELLLGASINIEQLEESQRANKDELTADSVHDVYKVGKQKKAESPEPKSTAITTLVTSSLHKKTKSLFQDILTEPTESPVVSTPSEPKVRSNTASILADPIKKPAAIIPPEVLNDDQNAIVLNDHQNAIPLDLEADQPKTVQAKAINRENKKENAVHLGEFRFDHKGDVIPDNAIIIPLGATTVTTIPKKIPKVVLKEEPKIAVTKTTSIIKESQEIEETKIGSKATTIKKNVSKEGLSEKKPPVQTPRKPIDPMGGLASKVKQIPSRSASTETKQNTTITNPVDWTFSLQAVSDDVYEVICTATIESGWHVYAMDNKNKDNGPYPLSIQFSENFPLTFLDQQFAAQGQLVQKYDSAFNQTTKYYTNQVVLKRKVKLAADQATVSGAVKFMSANQKNYLVPLKKQFTLQLPKANNNTTKAAMIPLPHKHHMWFVLFGMLLSTLGLGYMGYIYKKMKMQ